MRLLALVALVGCGRIRFDERADAGAIAGPTRIASVQRSMQVMSTAEVRVPIDAVDLARTFVICDHRTDDSAAGTMPTCELVSPTELVVTVGIANPFTVVGVQVIELAGGARVQRGSEPFVGETQIDATLEPVDPAHAFAIVQSRTDYPFSSNDGRFAVRGQLTAPTTLELTRDQIGTGSLDVAWQVVEIPELAAQHGTTTIVGGAVSATAPIDPAVDLSTTFIATSSRAQAEIEAEWLARGQLTSPMTLVLSRALAGPSTIDLAWSALSMPGASVQHGVTPTINQFQVDASITPVDLARSFVLTTMSGGTGLDTELDASRVTATFGVPGVLRFERGERPAINGMVSWFVVEWPQ